MVQIIAKNENRPARFPRIFFFLPTILKNNSIGAYCNTPLLFLQTRFHKMLPAIMLGFFSDIKILHRAMVAHHSCPHFTAGALSSPLPALVRTDRGRKGDGRICILGGRILRHRKREREKH